jgi:hypothetical protein
MPILTDSLLTGWDRNLDYARKLVADLSDEQMAAMPRLDGAGGPGANHPAWILSHLNVYHPVLVAMIEGRSFPDPREAPFGMLTKPQADRSLYKPKAELIGDFERGHAEVAAALRAADDAAFEATMPLERWQKPFPTVGSALGYIMLVHESTHLGQISTWRRVQGLPGV